MYDKGDRLICIDLSTELFKPCETVEIEYIKNIIGSKDDGSVREIILYKFYGYESLYSSTLIEKLFRKC